MARRGFFEPWANSLARHPREQISKAPGLRQTVKVFWALPLFSGKTLMHSAKCIPKHTERNWCLRVC